MRWDMLKLEMNYCFTQGSKIKFTICLFLKENSRATKMQRMLSVQTRNMVVQCIRAVILEHFHIRFCGIMKGHLYRRKFSLGLSWPGSIFFCRFHRHNAYFLLLGSSLI